MNLKRYWFEFSINEKGKSKGLGIYVAWGCGVTAYNYSDAVEIMKCRIFNGEELPPIRKFTENIDVSTLDFNHIQSNIFPPIFRGIWFPIGFQDNKPK